MRPLLLILSMFTMSCTTTQQAGGSLGPEAFGTRLSEEGAQLLDVRTAAEYNSGHLAHARNFDWTNGRLKAAVQELDKSKPVLLYCASGRRSAAAREYLVDQGFSDVVDLDGGIAAWRSAGKGIEP